MSIHYLRNVAGDLELIFCNNSTISYPLHNHSSMLTIGIVLEGSILLNTNNATRIYGKSQTFIIPPYMPHSINAIDSYSLLSICIHKRLLSGFQMSTDIGESAVVSTSDTCIDSLKRHLELFPEDKLSVEEMAQAAMVSKYHFIRCFKQRVGLTPHQFQIQNRIRKAQRLMDKNATMTEVALNTGFCDQSHFIKQFEKYVGLTPSTYKLSSSVVTCNTAI